MTTPGSADADDHAAGPIDLSLVVRMDLRVTDVSSLIDSAREAVRAAYPSASEEDIAREIGEGVEDAVFAIADAVGLDALIEETPGLEVRAVASEIAYGLDEISIEEDEGR